MKRFALVLLASTLSGCLSLGTDRVRPETAADKLQACSAEQALHQQTGDVDWELSYLGPAGPLTTARAPWGTILRYVVPYTRHTALYRLKVTNHSQQVIWVDPAHIRLQLANQAVQPLDLSFFEGAWPSSAVSDDDTMIDRSLAISEVTRTLFMRRPLEPGESYTGLLPFLRDQAKGQSLTVESQVSGETARETAFCLDWQPAA